MNMKKIVKRDGRIVDFDESKIKIAIQKAMVSTEKGVDKGLIEKIVKSISSQIKDHTHIEDIQEMVEYKLMSSNRKDVAQAYIRYRNERTEYRNKVNNLDKKINELIDMNESVAHENANKNSNVFNTKRDLLAGIVAKDYAERYMLPKHVVEAHRNGVIHWHDLDYSPFFGMYNCMLIDFKGMFEDGFTIGNADIETPKSIKTATALIAQIVANVSSNIYGGTTCANIDLLLEPYGEMSYRKYLKDAETFNIPNPEYYAQEKTKKEIYDSMQSLEYEINTLYNSNGQTPFFTIGFGLGTSWVAREIQKAIFEIRIRGLGKDGKTAVFPKLVFVLKDGLNVKPTDPNYDIKKLALECSVIRMYPDILSYDKIVEITGSFKFPMGCRSFLGRWTDENGNEVHDGRNNLGVVTLNLPRVALDSQDQDEFFERLEERLDLCKDALLYRISTLEKTKAKNAPILYMYGATGKRLKANENVLAIFKNGRASISLGYIGIHETVTRFYGNEWQDDPQAKEFSLAIMKKLRKAVDQWKEETGWGFSLYGTPAENLCFRFCNLDKKVYGIVDHVTDKGYYTNSFHLDVNKKVDPFYKIDFEKDYASYSSGGFIHYVEFPNLKNNPEALEAVWDYAYNKVGYFGTNTPIDRCFVCGYEGEFEAANEGFKCPNCGNTDPATSSCIRRMCGYLGAPIERPINQGKHEEMKRRVKHQ